MSDSIWDAPQQVKMVNHPPQQPKPQDLPLRPPTSLKRIKSKITKEDYMLIEELCIFYIRTRSKRASKAPVYSQERLKVEKAKKLLERLQ